ncbi:uncharacterized protein LOC126068679 [Elephas maximus indicus]|uniref:uncharacterized protein LOC126068679 n=1 Tax=Elephas maximus indicus TaxID=99487 RepID=UPI0021164198|nr:uncharacterized protein LOC126068679 [Elephas maximus indicus]
MSQDRAVICSGARCNPTGARKSSAPATGPAPGQAPAQSLRGRTASWIGLAPGTRRPLGHWLQQPEGRRAPGRTAWVKPPVVSVTSWRRRRGGETVRTEAGSSRSRARSRGRSITLALEPRNPRDDENQDSSGVLKPRSSSRRRRLPWPLRVHCLGTGSITSTTTLSPGCDCKSWSAFSNGLSTQKLTQRKELAICMDVTEARVQLRRTCYCTFPSSETDNRVFCHLEHTSENSACC